MQSPCGGNELGITIITGSREEVSDSGVTDLHPGPTADLLYHLVKSR